MRPLRLIQEQVKANQLDYKGFEIERDDWDQQRVASNHHRRCVAEHLQDLYKKMDSYLKTR